jgi:hypothetical protein
MKKAEPIGSSPDTAVMDTHGRRAARFFFMYLGNLVVIFVYFILCERAGYSVAGIRSALGVALGVQNV